MLKKNYEFKNVLSKKKYFSGKYLEMFITFNNKNDNFFGIAVSKKIANSVERNRVKRYVRENLRILNDKMVRGVSIVILWKKSVSVDLVNFDVVCEDLNVMFKKADLFNEV